jgi:hypothetical protein
MLFLLEREGGWYSQYRIIILLLRHAKPELINNIRGSYMFARGWDSGEAQLNVKGCFWKDKIHIFLMTNKEYTE